MIYLIGSLRNEKIPEISNQIEKETGIEVFDSWYSPGPRADDHWKSYETARGRNYKQALKHYAGQHIFEFDYFHLERSTIVILVLPAGKSCHLEFGYMVGRGRKGFVLMDNPDRWDVMYQFAYLNDNPNGICFSMDELIKELKKEK